MSVVSEHLTRRGLRFEVLPHERVFTAREEARTLGISPDEVVKAVVLDTPEGHVVAIVPGSRRIDLERVARALGIERVTLASEREIEGDFPQFELGALPPVPSLVGVPVVLDPEVLVHRTVTFAAGTQRESVRAEVEGLFTAPTVTIAPVCEHPAELGAP